MEAERSSPSNESKESANKHKMELGTYVCLKNIDVHLQHILLNVLMNKAGVVGDRFPVIDLPSLFECLIVSLSLVLHVSLNNMVYSVCYASISFTYTTLWSIVSFAAFTTSFDSDILVAC